MVCKHCGKEIPETSKQCPECKGNLVEKKKFNLFAKDKSPFAKALIGVGLGVLILIVLPLTLFGALLLHNTQQAAGDTSKAIVCGIFAVVCLVLVFACIMLTLIPVFNGVDGVLYCVRSWNGNDKKMKITLIVSCCSILSSAFILTELVNVVYLVIKTGLI